MWVLAYRYTKLGLVSKLLREGVLIAPLNTRYAQLEFNLSLSKCGERTRLKNDDALLSISFIIVLALIYRRLFLKWIFFHLFGKLLLQQAMSLAYKYFYTPNSGSVCALAQNS